MKKMMKRLSTLVLALVLAMALSVPMFAADDDYWTISIDNSSGPATNLYMNIYGSYNSSLNRRFISLYRITSGATNSDQRFRLMRSGSGFGDNFVLCASANNLYAINRCGLSGDNNGRAWMWPLNNNGYEDSRLKTPISDPYFLLVSKSYGNIGVNSAVNGEFVYFGKGTSWFAGGKPVFPLSQSNVDVNPYI